MTFLDWLLQSLNTRLVRIEAKLDGLATAFQKAKETIMADLTALTAQVKANTDTEASAVTLLKGLSDQISALKNDPVALQGLADQLKGSGDALAAAIIANTPAAP